MEIWSVHLYTICTPRYLVVHSPSFNCNGFQQEEGASVKHYLGLGGGLAWNHFGNENRLCREKMAYVRTGEPFVRSPSKKLPPLELAGGYLVNLGEELGTFMHRK